MSVRERDEMPTPPDTGLWLIFALIVATIVGCWVLKTWVL